MGVEQPHHLISADRDAVAVAKWQAHGVASGCCASKWSTGRASQVIVTTIFTERVSLRSLGVFDSLPTANSVHASPAQLVVLNSMTDPSLTAQPGLLLTA
jgi:hypothetical protein